MPYQILPSLLSANMMNIGIEVEAVIKAGADMIHFDVMDNHYVPNLTFGPIICKHMRQQFKTLPIDVHLMVSPVDELITQFAHAGATRISIHPDATIHLDRSLELIKKLGCEAGVVLNPATPVEILRWCMHRLDFVLVMTVNPGFGGQGMILDVIDKISLIREQYPKLPICVDGGINLENIGLLAKAGATQFVAGSAIFNSSDYAKTIKAMKNTITR